MGARRSTSWRASSLRSETLRKRAITPAVAQAERSATAQKAARPEREGFMEVPESGSARRPVGHRGMAADAVLVGDRVHELAVAAQAVRAHDVEVLGQDLDRLVEVVQREALAVPP